MPNQKREKEVVEKFAERLHHLHCIPVDVIEWPDEEHHGDGFWDATLRIGERDYILDHRQFGSFEGHFQDDAHFNDVVVPLQTELPTRFPELYIEVSIDVGAIPRGSQAKRANIHASLLKALIDRLPYMPDDDCQRKYQFPGVPFEVYVSKTREGAPDCFVGRNLPQDRYAQLIKGLEEAMRKKEEQFARFKVKRNCPTILLLDTDDFSSLNPETIGNAFCSAQEVVSTPSIDNIFFFYHRGGGNFLVFPLKTPDHPTPNKVEWQEYKRAQRVITWGWQNCGPPYVRKTIA